MIQRNLSIIIPHYNTPKLLERLIESIPQIDDIQIIVIDDRSDKDLDILNGLKDRYKDHVEFYRNDSSPKGAGSCRNIGLEHADGKWLLFSDADDFFLEGMYESVSRYFESDYDEVFFKPTSVYFDTGKLSNAHELYEKCVDNYLLYPTHKNLMRLKISLTTPWSKLIRHELVRRHKIRFDEVLYFNDMMFSVKIGHYSQKIAISDQVIYCIVRVVGSVSMRVGWDAYEIRLMEYLKVCDFLKEHYSLKDLKAMHYTCLGMLYRAVKNRYGIRRYGKVIALFYQHGIPFFTFDQISIGSLQQIFREHRAKRVDSRYMVK